MKRPPGAQTDHRGGAGLAWRQGPTSRFALLGSGSRHRVRGFRGHSGFRLTPNNSAASAKNAWKAWSKGFSPQVRLPICFTASSYKRRASVLCRSRSCSGRSFSIASFQCAKDITIHWPKSPVSPGSSLQDFSRSLMLPRQLPVRYATHPMSCQVILDCESSSRAVR